MLAYVGVPKIWGSFVQLQVPHKFCCAPVPLLSEIWGARAAPASSMAPSPMATFVFVSAGMGRRRPTESFPRAVIDDLGVISSARKIGQSELCKASHGDSHVVLGAVLREDDIAYVDELCRRARGRVGASAAVLGGAVDEQVRVEATSTSVARPTDHLRPGRVRQAQFTRRTVRTDYLPAATTALKGTP